MKAPRCGEGGYLLLSSEGQPSSQGWSAQDEESPEEGETVTELNWQQRHVKSCYLRITEVQMTFLT